MLLTSSPKNFDTNPTRKGGNFDAGLACENEGSNRVPDEISFDTCGEVCPTAAFEVPEEAAFESPATGTSLATKEWVALVFSSA